MPSKWLGTSCPESRVDVDGNWREWSRLMRRAIVASVAERERNTSLAKFACSEQDIKRDGASFLVTLGVANPLQRIGIPSACSGIRILYSYTRGEKVLLNNSSHIGQHKRWAWFDGALTAIDEIANGSSFDSLCHVRLPLVRFRWPASYHYPTANDSEIAEILWRVSESLPRWRNPGYIFTSIVAWDSNVPSHRDFFSVFDVDYCVVEGCILRPWQEKAVSLAISVYWGIAMGLEHPLDLNVWLNSIHLVEDVRRNVGKGIAGKNG